MNSSTVALFSRLLKKAVTGTLAPLNTHAPAGHQPFQFLLRQLYTLFLGRHLTHFPNLSRYQPIILRQPISSTVPLY